MKSKHLVAAILLLFSLSGSLIAQSPADLFTQKRVAAIYLDCKTPYQAAINFVNNIDDPANIQLKQSFEQIFEVSLANFFVARNRAKSNACAANMRVLMGGVEMYNLDNQVMMDKELDSNRLAREGYIKSAPTCPEGGVYSASGNLAESGVIQCSKHGTVENLIVPDAKSNTPDFSGLLKKISEFDRRALFKPNGGLYIAINSPDQGGFAVMLEADCKPNELLAFLKDNLKLPIAEAKKHADGSVSIPAPFLPKLSGQAPEIVLTSRGLYINPENSSKADDQEQWQAFFATAGKDANSLVLEIFPQPIIEKVPFLKAGMSSGSSSKTCAANMRVLLVAVEMCNIDAKTGQEMHSLNLDRLVEQKYLKSIPKCPNGGRYEETGDLSNNGLIKCSIHNTVENLKIIDLPPAPDSKIEMIKNIKILRLIVGENKSLLAAGVTDQKANDNLKKLLESELVNIKNQLQQLADAKEQQMGGSLSENDRNSLKLFREIINSASVFQKGTWTGIRANGIPGSKMAIPVVGVLAAIAIPNFRKARTGAREKACFANQRVLTGAMEMYMMDNTEPLTKLDIDVLVRGMYLKSPPQCPDGGEYSADFSSNGDFEVKCSIHGSYDQ